MVAGDEQSGVRTPVRRVLAALERPLHAVRIRLHPVHVDAPRRVLCVPQREHHAVLRRIGVAPPVLVVVVAELVVRRGGVVDGRGDESVGVVPGDVGLYRLADDGVHGLHRRFAHLHDLKVLERRVRAGVVVGEDELSGQLPQGRKRLGLGIVVDALHDDVRLGYALSADVARTLPVLGYDERTGAVELHEPAGERDHRRVPRALRPEHPVRASLDVAGDDVRHVVRRAARHDPAEGEVAARLHVDGQAPVVEDELSPLRRVRGVLFPCRVPVDALRRRQRVAEPQLRLDALDGEAGDGLLKREPLQARGVRGGAVARSDSDEVGDRHAVGDGFVYDGVPPMTRAGRIVLLDQPPLDFRQRVDASCVVADRRERRRNARDGVRGEPGVPRRVRRIAHDRRRRHGECVVPRRDCSRHAECRKENVKCKSSFHGSTPFLTVRKLQVPPSSHLILIMYASL